MTEPANLPGSATYSPFTLSIYDAFVLGFSNRLLWRCPTPRILELYQRHATGRHMDVGVGTGYFLDRCTFPTEKPTIALVDLNQHSLEYTARRIARYQPTTHRVNVLEPFKVDGGPFESVSLTYLLHCLPGDMASKAVFFDHLRPMLAPGAVVFGATIIGVGMPYNFAARALMRAYNKKGIFGNTGDTLDGLRAALEQRFQRHTIEVQGVVALFTTTA